jgi:hypothetical protein
MSGEASPLLNGTRTAPHMKDHEKDLLVSVTGSLREFASGVISLDQARTRFRDFRDRYKSLLVTGARPSNTFLLKSLCYDHNINNFSLMSGLLSFDGTAPRFAFFSGDDALASMASASAQKIIDSAASTGSGTIPSGEISKSPHAVHCSDVFTFQGAQVVFIAVSSSNYFTFSRFAGYAGVVKKIVEEIDSETTAMQFDCIHVTKKEIYAFLDECIHEKTVVLAQCFYFDLIDRIFSHLGPPMIMEISDQIVQDISAYISKEGRVFPLSIREYIAVTPEDSLGARRAGKKPVEFRYKGITIPYAYHEIPVRTLADRSSLWERFSEFVQENHAAANPER